MEEYVEYISRSPEDTARISAEIATQLRAGDIIVYEGAVSYTHLTLPTT